LIQNLSKKAARWLVPDRDRKTAGQNSNPWKIKPGPKSFSRSKLPIKSPGQIRNRRGQLAPEGSCKIPAKEGIQVHRRQSVDSDELMLAALEQKRSSRGDVRHIRYEDRRGPRHARMLTRLGNHGSRMGPDVALMDRWPVLRGLLTDSSSGYNAEAQGGGPMRWQKTGDSITIERRPAVKQTGSICRSPQTNWRAAKLLQ